MELGGDQKLRRLAFDTFLCYIITGFFSHIAFFYLGGSLTVQFLGTAPKETKTLDGNIAESTKSSQKDHYLSFSTVVVDSRKNVPNTQIKR